MKKFIVLLLIVAVTLSGCSRNKEVENELEESKKTIEELRSKLYAANERVAELEESVEEKKSSINTLTERVATLLKLNESLETYVSELEENQNDDTDPIDKPVSSLALFFYHYADGFLSSYVAEKDYDTYISLNIIGESESEETPRKLIDVSGDEEPTIAFNIAGILKNLRIERIKWNDEMTDYEVLEEVCFYEEVVNSTLLFNSILAEGLPGELLTWEDGEGNKNYYLIHDITMRGDVTLHTIISGKANLKPWWKENE